MPAVRVWLVVTALLSGVAILLMTVVLGALTPGYSHLSQFISELGASGAPYEWWARRLGFLPAGLSLLAFCVLAFKAMPRSTGATLGLIGLAVYAAGYVAASQFPCDPGCRPAEPSLSQVIHNTVGGLGYALAPGFLALLARASGGGMLAQLGYAAAAVTGVGLLTLTPASPLVGLSQRAIELAVLGWVALLGCDLARRN
ncbi:DUF998 domain-containing protein [Roseateles sp. NT4]|uniref:DUF998 domain-containing protein n=1 Tax=Roseateles sp. NT4 TaxID=3453715 RepID=UPI003EE9C64D